MATSTKTTVAKLTSKDFAVNPQTGKVLVSHDKVASLIQSNLNKIKGGADTKAIRISIGIDF
jgi:hypothetical protein